MPDLAPWLPLLAIPFDAEVADDPGDGGDRAGLQARARCSRPSSSSSSRVLVMPTLIVFEDAHWIDDASLASSST